MRVVLINGVVVSRKVPESRSLYHCPVQDWVWGLQVCDRGYIYLTVGDECCGARVVGSFRGLVRTYVG